MSARPDLLKRLAAINRAITSSLDFDELLRLVARSGVELLGGSTCLVLLREGEEELRVRASEGVDAEAARRFSGPLTEAVLERLAAHLDVRGPAPVSSPIMVDQTLQGILVLVPRAALDADETWLLSALADQTAVALRNARLYEGLKERDQRLEAEVEAARGLARQLTAAVQELEAFTYTVAHDLRGPLRAMGGLSDLLLDDCRDQLDEEHKDYLRRIKDASARMDLLIRDLLAYSRLCRGEMKRETVSLSAVIDDVLEEMGDELAESGARVEVIPPIPPVLGQAGILGQVVSNLVANAAKFVAPGVEPRIRISAETRDGWVRLWIDDNGIGIPPEHFSRVFRIFERLHPQDSYPGTGVGLAIVQRAIDRMSGRVGVDSRPGEGSRFWIELPEAGSPVGRNA
ncbi:MAG TPA: ATP-binding protein [Planctomycetota bacterium]